MELKSQDSLTEDVVGEGTQSPKIVIIDNDENESSTSSFISCILKYASNCYDAHIDFNALNLYEWQKLTKYSRLNEESKTKNTHFLNELEQFLHEDVEIPKIRKQIHKLISTYFGIRFQIEILEDQMQVHIINPNICYLFRDGNQQFSLILERTQRFPDANERAQSLLKDLRESSVLETHFKLILSNQEDAFAIRGKFLEIGKTVLEAQNIKEIFINSNALRNEHSRKLETTSENIRNHNDALLWMQVLMDCEKQLGYQESIDPSCIFEFKNMLLDELQSSFEIIYRSLRQNKENKERRCSLTIKYMTIEFVISVFTNLLQTLRSRITRESSKDRTLAYKSFQKVIQVVQLKSRLKKRRPDSLGTTLNYSRICYGSNFSFIFQNYDQINIPMALLEDSISPNMIENVKVHLKDMVTPYLDELDVTEIKLEATHLYLSQCVNQQLMNKIALLRQWCKDDEEILIHFVGNETLTIDVDLDQKYFHGINLSFKSKVIYVGENNNDGRIFTINVGGLDGVRHDLMKPPNPDATGCDGNNGLHGNPGESSGNVLIIAGENIVGFEYLKVLCDGGHGARGQDGGDGSNGDNGYNGPSAELPAENPTSGRLLHFKGEPGTSGENGGSSGLIGIGGEGGFGGIKEVQNGGKIIKESGQDGKIGENGSVGKPGVGGKGGKNGVDRAWLKYSFWHSWQKEEGKEGEESLIITYHNGWFIEGYEVKSREAIPQNKNGAQGVVRENQNNEPILHARKRRNNTKKTTINSMQVEDKPLANTKETRIEEYKRKISLQRRLKRDKKDKIIEIEEIYAQTKKDFRELYRQLENTITATRAVEKYVMQNTFSQLPFITPSADTTDTDPKRKREFSLSKKDDDLEKGIESSNHSDDLARFLEGIDSLDMFRAAEKFIKSFTFEKDFMKAYAFMKVLVHSKYYDNPTTVYILNAMPAAYEALKNTSPIELPSCNENEDIVTYLTKIIHMEKFDLSDEILTSDKLNVDQKNKILILVLPCYFLKYIPELKEVIDKSKTKSNYRVINGIRSFWQGQPREGLITDEGIKEAIKIILNQSICQIHPKKPPQELLLAFKSHIVDYGNSMLSLEDLTEKFLSSPAVLNNYTKVNNMLNSKTKPEKIVKYIKEVGFIFQHFNYDTGKLDAGLKIVYKLQRDNKKDEAIFLKESLDASFKSRIQTPLLDDLFQKFNFPLETTIRKRSDLEAMLETMETYTVRKSVLEAMKSSCAEENNWEKTIEKLKNHALSDDGLEYVLKWLKDKDSFSETCKIVKRVQFSLKYPIFTNMNKIENNLINLYNFLKDKEYPLMKDFEFALTQFWRHQLNSTIVKGIVMQRFDSSRFLNWIEEVKQHCYHLLESNRVLEPDKYSVYISLKLTQLAFFALRDNDISSLESLEVQHNDDYDVDEIEGLGRIMIALHSRDLPFPSHSLGFIKFDDFKESFNLLISPHKTFNDFQTGLDSFLKSLLELIKDHNDAGMISQLNAYLEEVELLLVTNWKNVHFLTLFHEPETHSLSLEPAELREIDKAISKTMMSPLGKHCKSFFKTLKYFCTQNFTEQTKHFDEMFRKQCSFIDQAVSSIKAVIMDDDRIVSMLQTSLKNQCCIFDEYHMKWDAFNGKLVDLLEVEGEYYSSALLECNKDDFVDLGVEADEQENPESQSNFVDTIPKVLLHRLVEISCSRHSDKSILPTIQLTLQLMEGDPCLEVEFLRRCMNISTCPILFYTMLKETMKLNSSKFSNLIGIEHYCDENVTNGVRKLIVKLQVSDMKCDTKQKFVALFLNDDSRVVNETEIKDFRTLLSVSESKYLDLVLGSLPTQEFKLPGNLNKYLEWEEELQHMFVFQSLSNLLQGTNEVSEKDMSDILDTWRRNIESKGNCKDYKTWMELMSKFLQEIKMLPMPIQEVLEVFDILKNLPLSHFKNLLEQHLPATYLKYAMFDALKVNLLTKMSISGTEEALEVMNDILLSQEKRIWRKILEIITEQISSLKTEEELCSFFDNTFYILQSMSETKGKFETESVANILCSWSSLPMGKWKSQLRAINKFQEFVQNDSLLKLVMEVDEKFPLHTRDFISTLEGSLSISQLSAVLVHVLEKKWVLDSTVIEQIKKRHSPQSLEEIENTLIRYSNNVATKELTGTPLVDSIVQGYKNDLSEEQCLNLKRELLEDLRGVRQRYKDPSCLLMNDKKIKDFSEEDISSWVKQLKDWRQKHEGIKCFSHENLRRDLLAVINRGIQLKKQHVLRDTQLAAVLIFLYAAIDGKGRFGEIATSEGKTLISAAASIAIAVDEHNVFIITSSAVLAEDGYKSTKSIFALFDIGVANISSDEARTQDPEKILEKLYKNRVLFGDSGSFQADFLQCNYLGKTYKRSIDTGYLFVDEVDSLLLDKGSNVLYISHNIPELRYLNSIFMDIWTLVLKDMNKSLIDSYIQTKYIRKEKVKIFKYLHSFVKERIPLWINNAFVAKEMKEDVPYILSQGDEKKVTVVDNDTGVEQKQTQYSYGLHQFLQLKEGNPLSSESLKAVFVSNVGYFSGFRGRIFGITGTLGDNTSKNILNDLYNVDFFKMPRHKQSKRIKEPPKLFSDKNKYEEAILDTISKREGTQPVLLICETVKQCKEVYSFLKKTINASRLKCMYESKEYHHFMEQLKTRPILPGFVLISTNLAGRGTDLRLCANQCQAKGLHVVLLYIPPNLRVEKQAFGRTARAGQNGSTEYIVFNSRNNLNLDSHWEEMSQYEAMRLQHVKKVQVPQIKLEEKLFGEFANKLKIIKRSFETAQVTGNVSEVKLNIVKNRWAFWLDGVQCDLQMHYTNPKVIKAKILKKYYEFCAALDKIINDDVLLCYSPSDFVKLAHAYEDNNDLGKSLVILTAGIDQEPHLNHVLHYYRGVLQLKFYSGDFLVGRKLARKDLKMAMQRIKERNDGLVQSLSSYRSLLATFLEKDKMPCSKNLETQLQNERKLLSNHEWQFLQPAIGHVIDENSFKLIQIVNQDGEESQEIYETLLAVRNLLKPLRVSKKLKVNGNTIQLNGKNLDFTVNYFSQRGDCLQDILFKHLNSENNSERLFDKSKLKDVIVDREELLNAIKNSTIILNNVKGNKNKSAKVNWLQNIHQYELFHVFFDDLKFTTEFTAFPKHKITIAKILGENNLRSFTEEDLKKQFQTVFPDIELQKTMLLELESSGYVIRETHFTALIPLENLLSLKFHDGRILGLPQCIECYNSILTPWLVNSDGKINPNIDTATIALLPKSNEDIEINDIVYTLVEEGILRKPKVDWSLSQWSGREKTRTSEIQKTFAWISPEKTVPLSTIDKLRKTFYKFHEKEISEIPQKTRGFVENVADFTTNLLSETKTEVEKEFEKYLESISKLLLDSVGKTKTIRDMKIEFSNLAANYRGRQLPPEYLALREEDFDRVPSIKKKTPWFSSGALFVSVLALLQIAAGVTIGVLSGGTLANVSMMFISEGGSDLLYAIQSGLQGSFSWKGYGVHKAVSVAFSLVTGGLGGITKGSWATIIAMEALEEIAKKTLWTVSRYTAQGIGTTLANMTIEKAMDWTKSKVLSGARVAFTFWSQTNEAYQNAKKRLKQSLNSLYNASYLHNQAETTVLNAKNAMGPKSPTSLFAHHLTTSMRRIASFYMSKLTEKLGHGLLNTALKLTSMFNSTFSIITSRLQNLLTNFAMEYVNELSEYYEREASLLEQRGQTRSTFFRKKDDHERNQFVSLTADAVDSEVLEAGLDKLQYEIAEPALQQMSAKWIDKKCSQMFKESGYNSKMSSNEENSKNASFMPHTEVTVPSVLAMNTRLGIDFENEVRNNIWDIKFKSFELNPNFYDKLLSIKDRCEITLDETGQSLIGFILQGSTIEEARVAERAGISIIRRLHLKKNF